MTTPSIPPSLPSVAHLLRDARSVGSTALDEPQSKEIVARYGLRVPAAKVVNDASAAVAAFLELDGPVAIKLISPGLHKSDIGGVALGLDSEAGVRAAVESIITSARSHDVPAERYLVERMADRGHEVVIGGFDDSRFGPVIMLGLGGVFVEVFDDVAFRICPIDAQDAHGMIDSLKSVSLLRGVRGGTRIDQAELVRALLAIGGESGLLVDHADAIAEIDLNPVIVTHTSATVCDARVILRTDKPGAFKLDGLTSRRDQDIVADFDALFEPKTLAVAGASASSVSMANDFIRQSLALGFKGRMIPIHPSADTVEGLPAVRTLADIDGPIDYLYIAVAAPKVPEIIRAGAGKVKFAQVISSGFSEIEAGKALEADLAAACRESGVRALGPNCLGLYSPRGGLAFIGDCSSEAGPVGIISQSGGLGVDVILRGKTRGIRFSGLVTLGNSVDIGPADLLEYYLADDRTRVIGVYLEDVKNGRRFFDALRRARARKPVMLLLGGQTDQGGRAAASHTGSLATPLALWRGLAEQTGAILAQTLEQFLDQLTTFQALTARVSRPTHRCVLFGNGGGTSVLAADAFAREGLDVSPMPPAAINALDAMALPSGTSVVNPIDTPGPTLRQQEGRVAEQILDVVCSLAEPDAVITHLNLPVFVSSANQKADYLANLTQAVLRVKQRYPGRTHFALVLRSDGSEACDARKRAFRREAMAQGIPVYDELANAAAGLGALARYERFLAARTG